MNRSVPPLDASSVLAGEKRAFVRELLERLDLGLPELGRLATRTSLEVADSNWAVGCECLDRDYADWHAYKSLLPQLGVKHARVFSGWAKTEREKGRYDFEWLDPIVRECAASGVKPWICLAYGNPVWGSDFTLGMRVRQVTDNSDAFAAWLRYCTAVVERYGDVVDEWEVWNEPFGQGPEYAELFYRTARAVRAVQPSARIYCTAVNFPADFTCVLEKLKSEKALELGSLFCFHPYWTMPEASYRIVGVAPVVQQGPDFQKDVRTLGMRFPGGAPGFPGAGGRDLRALVKSYSPDFDIMNGESGCPSQLEFDHALANAEWTELSQAKWLLRRALLDASAGMRSCAFAMADNQYPNMLQSFGLVRTDAHGKVMYRRPSWFAMRNVYGLLDVEARPTGLSRDGALWRADFDRAGTQLSFFWFGDARPSDDRIFEPVRLAHGFADPVAVEMVTGRIFDLGGPKAPVPLWDSPMLVCERDSIGIVDNGAPPSERGVAAQPPGGVLRTSCPAGASPLSVDNMFPESAALSKKEAVRRPPISALRPNGTPEGRTDADGTLRPQHFVRAWRVDGREVTLPEGADILNLAAIYPDAVAYAKEGTRVAEAAFRVRAASAGTFRFRIASDWAASVAVNGRDLGAIQDVRSWTEWAELRLALPAGESKIVIRTRAGFLGFWQLGVELPPTGVEEVGKL